MRNFFASKKIRTIMLLLSFLFLILGLCLASLFRYGIADLWYRSETSDFSDTTQCYSYVHNIISSVVDNFDQMDSSEYEQLDTVFGKAVSFRVSREGDIIYDSTGAASSFVLSQTGNDGLIFEGFINPTIEPSDGCYTEYRAFTFFFSYRYLIMAGMLVFILTSLILFTFSVVGSVEAGGSKQLSVLEKLPLDGLMLSWAAVYVGIWLLLRLMAPKLLSLMGVDETFLFLQMGWGVLCQWLISSWVYLAVYFACGQLMAKTLLSGSLVYRLSRRVTFTGVVICVGSLHLLITLVMGVLYRSRSGSFIFPAILVIADVVVIIMLLVFIRDSNIIRNSVHDLACGDLHSKTNVRHLHFIWRNLGEELNAIGDGMSLAVEERMRSERMKTELITNVSHDLKTPLTSIVNYVDLLKKKNITDEDREKYLAVLERQSSALKRLTEDVVEASKAASGALKVESEILDAREFVKQVIGEYTERLENANIEPVLLTPEYPLYILADGRHLWRVLDNLMTNIIKYALPGTRAYVDLTDGEYVCLSVKNISRDSLNISPDRLMERFVRGDSSRRKEGSGLGLSIARSLTELMKGKFDLSMDGDLFRVDIRFEKQSAPDFFFLDD